MPRAIPQQRVGDTGADGQRLHRIAAGRGGDVVQQLFAAALDVAGHLRLDGLGADALADVAGGFRDAYAELLDGVGQARARLLGFSLYLLQRTGVGHGVDPLGDIPQT